MIARPRSVRDNPLSPKHPDTEIRDVHRAAFALAVAGLVAMELVDYAVEVGALGDANLPYSSRSANTTARKSYGRSYLAEGGVLLKLTNLRALKSAPNGFRIRVGDWHISYARSPGKRHERLRDRPERRSIPMSDPLRLRPLGEHAALVRDRLAGLTGAELVDDPDRAELVVMTPEHSLS